MKCFNATYKSVNIDIYNIYLNFNNQYNNNIRILQQWISFLFTSIYNISIFHIHLVEIDSNIIFVQKLSIIFF